MVVLMVLGLFAYFQLGQDEDPPFTFRAMVVQAYWPGATAQQVAEQVTDKIERTLQEVPYADTIRSYTKPGESLTIFQVKDSTPPKEVSEAWYQVRKKHRRHGAHAAAGRAGAVLQRRVRRCLRLHLRAVGRWLLGRGTARLRRGRAPRCCACPCGQGGAVRRADREGQVEISRGAWRSWGWT
jgi:hypothetical protein